MSQWRDVANKVVACSDLYVVYIVGLTSGSFFFFCAPRILKLFAYANSARAKGSCKTYSDPFQEILFPSGL